ncbi:MAG: hypothetical protein Q9210_005711 [Variospora velana]
MASTSESKSSSFNILGSSKLNTADGKNPAPSTSKPSVNGSSQQVMGSTDSDDYHKQCAKAHNELEARLRDEELNGRSRAVKDK